MNTLKPVVVMLAISAVAYGVYMTLTDNPVEKEPEFGEAELFAGPGDGATTWQPDSPPELNASISPGILNTPGNLGEPTTDTLGSGTERAFAASGTMPSTSVGAESAPTAATIWPKADNAEPAPSPLTHTPATPGNLQASTPYPPVASSVPASNELAPSTTGLPSDATGSASLGRYSPGGAMQPALGSTSDSTGNGGIANGTNQFETAWATAQQWLRERRLADTLRSLSAHYGSPTLTSDQATQLVDLLDQLAGTVIYSREHLLEQPYIVRDYETLDQIAQAHRVPWQLLAKINGIRDPMQLPPGKQLKVLRGPFQADVNLTRQELTLMVGGMYAGRFPVGIGLDRANLEGTYVVREMTLDPEYRGIDRVIPAAAPDNPLGRYWIGLDEGVGIHGSNVPIDPQRPNGRGFIALGNHDIEDVFSILATGSQVVIRR